ncbi:MAG: glycosyltransferase [Patescibacteria group bacterium]
MKEIFLSIVIPCYDEMANLQKGVLDKVQHFFSKEKFSYEVIIVDDGSSDGSVQFLEEFIKENPEFRMIKGKHYGKAGAVTKGVLATKGQYVLFTDMDQATPIEELDNLLPYLKKGYAVVIGSRNATRKGAPWTRVFMAKSMMFLRGTLVGLKDIRDTQCGFKLFSREAAQRIFRRVDSLHEGFAEIAGSSVTAGFDVELLFLASQMGYKIKEVPVHWLYVETRRVSPIRDSIEGVLSLIRIRQNALQGKYKEVKR